VVSFISAVQDAAITIAPYAVDQLKGWQQMATELKPCPFCGREAKIRDFSIPDLDPEIDVFCTNCGGQTFVYETEAEAIEAWNRRAEDGR
jgi:Lar family restriction alleviation protein